MDKWQTFHIPMRGGLFSSVTPVEQGVHAPGSLIRAVNVERNKQGGYRRLSGYIRYDEDPLPGEGPVLGAFLFEGSLIACRGEGVYAGSGNGWTHLNEDSPQTGAQKYRKARYNWAGPSIILVDGANYPVRWNGSSYTVLDTAPLGASTVIEHKGHMFFGVGNSVIFSAPNDETLYDASAGAGEINIGQTVLALGSWRDQLYIFCRDRIVKLVGNHADDFMMQPVSSRIGIVHPDTVQEVAGDLVFLAADGVRTVAGTERIGDVELGSVSEAIFPDLTRLGAAYINGTLSSVLVNEKAQYRLFAASPTTPDNIAEGFIGCVVGGTEGIGWEWYRTEGIKVACADSSYINNSEIVVHGGYDGYVYQQEIGNSFNGQNILAVLQLPYITYDDPELRKTLHKIRLYFLLEGTVDLRLAADFDYGRTNGVQPPEIRIREVVNEGFSVYGAAVYGQDVYGSDARVIFEQNLIGSGLNNSFVFVSNDQNASWTIQEAVVEYALYGRR